MTQAMDHLDELASLEKQEHESPRTMGFWVPSEEVSVYEVEIPDIPQRKRVDMLPWLLEDQLLRPAEELHFVLGVTTATNKTLVYVVAKDVMNQWLMLADAKSVKVDKFVPDFLALPVEDDYWTLSVQGSRLIVRTGNYTGFSADTSIGWQLLELQLEKAGEVRLAALVEDESRIPQEWRERIQTQAGALNWGFIEPPAVNLLSGKYKPTATKEFKPWLPTIGFATAALVMLLMYMMVQSYQWQKDLVVLDEAIVQAYRDLFGEAWSGSRNDIRVASESRMNLMQHQTIALQTSPLVELRAVDAGLSSCTTCDLQSVVQESESVSFTLTPASGLRSRLSSTPNLSFDWGDADEEGILELIVSAESGDD